MDAQQFRTAVVRPVLESLGAWSASAEALLLGTAAQESGLGHYLEQLGGPALGVYQCEPATHSDLWQNFLSARSDLAHKVRGWASQLWPNLPHPLKLHAELIGNLYYATAICRAHYLRVPEPLPAADDIEGLAAYYKRHYNTAGGAATVAQFQANWRQYVAA